MIKWPFCITILFFIFFKADGQDINAQKPGLPPDTSDKGKNTSLIRGTTVYARVIGEDTIPYITLREFAIYTPRVFKSEKEAKHYGRLLRDVKKAYPYAKIASQKLKEYNEVLAGCKTERERRHFLKIAEKEMKAEFENDLKSLTLRQGRILIKLVDRETGSSSYTLVKELKGSFSAFMWQSIARMFGSSLKDEYDAEGEDKTIEEIIILIENGDV